MDPLHQSELELIAALQDKADLADVMRWASYLGWEGLWFVLPFVYLCCDRWLGGRLILLYFVNLAAVNLAKLTFHAPRPCWIDERVVALSGSGGFGMPSGHAQLAVAVWFFLALAIKKPVAWVLAAAIALSVSVSRVYLGVHFVSDVLGGWALGAIVLFVFLRAESKAVHLLRSRSFANQAGLTLAVAGFVFILGLLVDDAVLRVLERTNPARASKGAGDLGWLYDVSGGLVGTGVGLAMVTRTARYEIRECAPIRLCSYLWFMAAAYVIWRGFDWLSLGQPHWWGNVVRLLRYSTTAWLIVFFAPWALSQLSLGRSTTAPLSVMTVNKEHQVDADDQ